MKSAFAFASRHFWCFDCQSRILDFAVWLLFLLVSLISTGVFVKMPLWMNQNCFVVTWLMTYVCLHFLHPHRKETYIKKLSNILLTDPQLTWGGNLTDFNFLRSISTFCTYKKIKLSAALCQWACWKFCNLPSLWSEVHNLIPVYRITPFCSEALLSSPNLVLPSCSLALVDNYN